MVLFPPDDLFPHFFSPPVPLDFPSFSVAFAFPYPVHWRSSMFFFPPLGKYPLFYRFLSVLRSFSRHPGPWTDLGLFLPRPCRGRKRRPFTCCWDLSQKYLCPPPPSQLPFPPPPTLSAHRLGVSLLFLCPPPGQPPPKWSVLNTGASTVLPFPSFPPPPSQFSFFALFDSLPPINPLPHSPPPPPPVLAFLLIIVVCHFFGGPIGLLPFPKPPLFICPRGACLWSCCPFFSNSLLSPPLPVSPPLRFFGLSLPHAPPRTLSFASQL